MTKVFYNPKTLKVMGMSDGDNSMEFPYLETAEEYHSPSAFVVVAEKGKPTLKITNIPVIDKIARQEGIIQLRQERKTEINTAKEALKAKLADGETSFEDIKTLLSKIL
jgi:hypothetical protein